MSSTVNSLLKILVRICRDFAYLLKMDVLIIRQLGPVSHQTGSRENVGNQIVWASLLKILVKSVCENNDKFNMIPTHLHDIPLQPCHFRGTLDEQTQCYFEGWRKERDDFYIKGKWSYGLFFKGEEIQLVDLVLDNAIYTGPCTLQLFECLMRVLEK